MYHVFFKFYIYFSQEQLRWVPSAETDGELPSSPPLSLFDSPVRIFIFGYISVYIYVTIFGFLLAFYKSFKIMLYIVDLNLRIGPKIKSMKNIQVFISTSHCSLLFCQIYFWQSLALLLFLATLLKAFLSAGFKVFGFFYCMQS